MATNNSVNRVNHKMEILSREDYIVFLKLHDLFISQWTNIAAQIVAFVNKFKKGVVWYAIINFSWAALVV